jgi:hypothetical protein
MNESWRSTNRTDCLVVVLCAGPLAMLAGCGGDAHTAAIERSSTVAESTAEGTSTDDAPRIDPNRTLNKSFDDIKFDIEPDAPFERTMLTPEIEAMSGQRIKIHGYMLPTARSRGIDQFVLVRDNQECCFGPGAALYDCILVNMNDGKKVEHINSEVAVEGVFHVDVFQPFERVMAVYRLEADDVED